MKVLVAGASGQLGRELCRTAPPGALLYTPQRAELDIGEESSVAAAISTGRPELIINAAAYTAVDRAEQEPEEALRVNAMGAEHLARAAEAAGARLIHLSTDYVFDGRSGRPYAPQDPVRPVNRYGHSKAEGERRVMAATSGRAVVVRTSWLYAAGSANFVHTMLDLFRARDQISVVSDQIGTPTWARGLAQALWSCAGRPEMTGIFHWTDAGVCSWYDFSVAIREEAAALGLVNRPCAIDPIPTSAWPTPAARPAFSVLDKDSTWRALGQKSRHWRESLRAMLRELKSHDQG